VLLGELCACGRADGADELNSPADWTIIRGGSSLSGYTTRRLPDEPALLWTYRHGVRTVAAPIVYDSIAYICDKNGLVQGIADGGRKVFDYDLDTQVEASFTVSDSVAYIGRIDGFLTALSLPLADTLWQYETEGQISAAPNLLFAEGFGRVFVGSYDGSLYTFDAATGECLHKVETDYYINGATAMWHEYAVFGGCDAWLRIVNSKTGEQTDTMKLDAYIPSSPAVWGNEVYVADYAGNVYEVTIADGRFVKHRKLIDIDPHADEPDGMVSAPTVSKQSVLVLTAGRYLTCIDRKSGTTRWQLMLKGDVGECAPLVCRDHVLVCTKTGIVSIVNEADGGLLWEYETGEQIIAPPAILDRRFYVLTAKGTLLCFGDEE